MSHAPLAQTRSRRRGLAALAAAGTAGVMSLVGCGIQSTGVKVVGAAPTLQAADGLVGSSAGSGTNGYALYFFRGGRLTSVERYTDQAVTDELVLQALIKGPDSTDASEGFTSNITPGLSVVSNQALAQKWAYEYSLPLTESEMAEVVCTVQADVDAPSVGTLTKGYGLVWHDCSDFTEDYGAPAVLPSTGNGPDGAVASDVPSQ